MPFYESVFIARQDISAQAVEELADQLAGVITEAGGKITKRENWGLRSLAYRMNKNRKGHYVLFNMDTPIPGIHEMERQMRLNEDVLRFLTIRLKELDDTPSAILTNKGRDDRPRGPRPGGPGGRFGGDRDDRPRSPRPPRADSAESKGDE